ncbi:MULTISPECIES: TonB-dependent receptor [unclassified Leeuwenhoekiella]|uniref:SusC/RagA family TonB-linked outer membrane protein n=1 Tax=unclassified Leeuwenhoekiella TaxID=2615029 RepID=UPI000C4702B5|nr:MULTISPECIES: TonB-dependent receptor [unclassified Leeuwenhoekiella]MAW95434.1 SusC/RagA family TonB-linked outer membrane protein [Leeuwenhoekiella sp.]MBA80821.1 SusC/RagA family TonB-linked outer membrane protein [Leeuwenhoekiella sp.]|tara:strand:+ start:46234 stop:49341 length:3108 start_codon:yes stop_codon:yes gene_type:complete
MKKRNLINLPFRNFSIQVYDCNRNKKRFGLIAFLLLFLQFSYAQETIQGVVTDVNAAPIPGVTVLEKGTGNGTQTDFDGNYSLTVAGPESVLVFSFVGMKTIELEVGARNEIDVVLEDDVASLEEVVVVGYGTQVRSRVAGAVDQISQEAFDGRSSANVTQSLQGKAPGLTIQQRNSEPGAPLNINIRGISTLGNNSPLIVIDGIVGGDLNSLNPSDIESVSVLKDAGSAAIYGSRANNGVVLITTKKGNKGRAMTVQYNGLSGMNNPHFFTRPVEGYENAILRNESAFNSDGVNSAVFTPAEIREFRENGSEEWFAEEIVQPALMQNHSFAISGGNENTTYRASIGYTDEKSIFVGPEKGLKRYNYRINLTSEFEKFRIETTLAYAKQKIKDHSFSTGTLMVDAFRTPLYYRQKDEEGNYLTNAVLGQFNPLGILEQGGFRNYDNDDLFGSLSLQYAITDKFKIRGVFGGRLYNNSLYSRTKRVDFVPGGVYGENRDTRDEMRKSLDLNTQFIAEYTNTFADKHDLNVLLGVSNENHSDRGIGIFRINTDPDLGTPISETTITDASYNSNQSSSKNSLNSAFGRASYTFDNRYTAEFSFRYDGSSKFRKDLRWGFFPSASLIYNVTNEDFLENYKDNYGSVKFRGSYGVLGNQNVGDFQYQTTYFTFQNAYAYNNEAVSGTGYDFANPDLQWERAATLNLGVDLDFFNKSLYVSFDWFNKITRDILVAPVVPGVFGTDLPDFNAGEVRSYGWELSATYRHTGKLFSHTLTANIGDTQNEVLAFQDNESLRRLEELQVILREGLPYRSYVGLKRAGIFQSFAEIENSAVPVGLSPVPGDNKYVDLNEDGVIDDDDQFIFGNPFPRYTFGLTYNVEVKGFDLSVFVQGVGKRTMMVRGEQVEPFHFGYGATMYTHQLDYWTPQNPDAYFPRLANNGTQSNTNNYRRGSDMYLFDGAYARLKNVQLGYTIPQSSMESIGIQKARFYLSGSNLLTLAKTDWLDPELSEFDSNLSDSGANSARAYPTLIYYGLGLDITF